MKRFVGKALAWCALTAFSAAVTGCTQTPADSGQSGSADGSAPDLGQMEIVFACTPGTYIPEESTDPEGYKEGMEWIAALEKKYNCRIRIDDYTPWDVYHQKLIDLPMAGEYMADIVGFDNPLYPRIMITGLLAPLEDKMNVNNFDVWDKEMQQYFTYKDHVYGVSLLNKEAIPDTWFLFNKTLFEEKGLDAKYNVHDLIMNKEWTWEKFREILRDCTMDTNGDGVTDIWGLGSGGLQFGRLMNAFVRSNRASYTQYIDNRVELTIQSPEFLEAFEYLYSLTWQDQVISTEEKWLGYDTLTLFTRGECMFYNVANWQGGSMKDMVPDGTILSVVPTPIGPNAGGEYISFKGDYMVYGVMANSPHPKEAAMVFEDFIANKPQGEQLSVREKYSAGVFDTDSLDVIELLTRSPATIEFTSFGYPSLNNFVLSHHSIPDKTPPATVVEWVKDSIQQEIDQTWAAAG